MINYIIDGHNIRDEWEIFVSESSGIVDIPELKERAVVDWAEYHGEVIDDRTPKYKAKKMTLKCLMACADPAALVAKSREINELFARSGLHRLEVALSPTTSLFFDVILDGAISFSKKWRDANFVAEFDIVLKEPEPMKKVLKFTSSDLNRTARINITTAKSVSINWGDGNVSPDLYGTDAEIVYNYQKNGEFVIIIHGDIDELTVNETNTETIWNKLL